MLRDRVASRRVDRCHRCLMIRASRNRTESQGAAKSSTIVAGDFNFLEIGESAVRIGDGVQFTGTDPLDRAAATRWGWALKEFTELYQPMPTRIGHHTHVLTIAELPKLEANLTERLKYVL